MGNETPKKKEERKGKEKERKKERKIKRDNPLTGKRLIKSIILVPKTEIEIYDSALGT